MATLRDQLLAVADSLRALPNTFGLRRYAVTLRRRVWSGPVVSQGTPTDQDIVLSPPPKVRDAFSGSGGGGWSALEYILQHGQVIADRYFTLSKITPAYVNQQTGIAGGYTPLQLRMEPPPDAQNIECLVILSGDDGVKRECVQVQLDLDRAFGYSMLVKETDRPRLSLKSIALTLSGTQISAQGTFDDGSVFDVTGACLFTTDNVAVTTPTVIGVLGPGASGTANLRARIGKILSNSVAFVR